MRDLTVVRRIVLAGALALSLTGVTAGVDVAQAMPVAASVRQVTVDAAPALTDAAYYGYRRHRRAGLYNCAPGTLRTHLSRKACGGRFPRQMMHRY